MQDIDSVRSSSLQLISPFAIFFNMIFFYQTFSIDFSIKHNQANNNPLRWMIRLTQIFFLSTASHKT